MRLSILSNVNLDMLSGLLKKENEVFQTDGYGEWITYALKKDERLAAFAPECLFLLLDGNVCLTVHTRELSIRIPRNRSKRCSSRECFWLSRPRITARMCRVHFVRIHI